MTFVDVFINRVRLHGWTHLLQLVWYIEDVLPRSRHRLTQTNFPSSGAGSGRGGREKSIVNPEEPIAHKLETSPFTTLAASQLLTVQS